MLVPECPESDCGMASRELCYGVLGVYKTVHASEVVL